MTPPATEKAKVNQNWPDGSPGTTCDRREQNNPIEATTTLCAGLGGEEGAVHTTGLLEDAPCSLPALRDTVSARLPLPSRPRSRRFHAQRRCFRTFVLWKEAGGARVAGKGQALPPAGTSDGDAASRAPSFAPVRVDQPPNPTTGAPPALDFLQEGPPQLKQHVVAHIDHVYDVGAGRVDLRASGPESTHRPTSSGDQLVPRTLTHSVRASGGPHSRRGDTASPAAASGPP